MSVKPVVRSFQDLPPAGGYPQVDFKKGIRPRGPSGFVIWATVVGCSVYGLYKLGGTNERRRFLRKEKREVRMAILPYLQAERDRGLFTLISAQLKQEEEIMKDVNGWKVGESVYSKRWSAPKSS